MTDFLKPSRVDELNGAPNELSLILQRGAASYSDKPLTEEEWKDQWICGAHLDELSRKWDKHVHFTMSGRKKMCVIDGQRQRDASIDIALARHLLQTQGVHYHAGAGYHNLLISLNDCDFRYLLSSSCTVPS